MEKNIFEVVPINEESEESLNFDATMAEGCKIDHCTAVDFCSSSGCDDSCWIDFTG